MMEVKVHSTISPTYYINNRNDIDYIIEIAQKGIKLLQNNNIDYSILTIWQQYVQSVLKFISTNSNTNYYDLYMKFNLSIFMYPPYDQIKMSIEFFIMLAKKYKGI